MIKLLIAFILGGMFGTVIMAVCAASGHASECEECWERRLSRWYEINIDSGSDGIYGKTSKDIDNLKVEDQ